MKLLTLISGGIDSPVAAHIMLDHGHDVGLVHFDNGHYQNGGGTGRVENLASVLAAAASKDLFLFTVDNEDMMEIISREGKGLACVICKRNMVRNAGILAAKEGFEALVMGDSLGQVASQTMDNIATIEKATNMPILRPLIGLDKTEIMEMARVIGTYGISIAGASECTVVPGSPAVRSNLRDVEAIEAGMDWMVDPSKLKYRKARVSAQVSKNL